MYDCLGRKLILHRDIGICLRLALHFLKEKSLQ